MPDPDDSVYRFADLANYSASDRLLIRLAALVFYALIRLCGMTIRFEVQGAEHLAAVRAGGRPAIIGFWHDRIFLGTYYFRDQGIVVLGSKSFDAEYTARVIQRFGYGSIRGSSSSGASRALIGMIRGIRRGLSMAFTLDGPRGPKYKVKAGAIMLARKTGSPILPFLVEPRSFFRLKSWDRMHIPLPFSRALAIIGEPIYVDSDATDVQIAEKGEEVQRALDEIVERGRQWREG